MKKVLVAALLSGVAFPAHAEIDLVCGPGTIMVGDPGNPYSKFRVVETNVRYSLDKGWFVGHRLADGEIMVRSAQYALTDYSSRSGTVWRGAQYRTPAITMRGEIRRVSGSQYLYHEQIWDARKGGAMVGDILTDCQGETVADAPVSAPVSAFAPIQASAPLAAPVAAPAPVINVSPPVINVSPPVVNVPAPVVNVPASTPAPAPANSIPLTSDGHGGFAVDALVNGTKTVRLMLDTGASDVVLTQDIMIELMANGTLSPNDVTYGEAILADGSTRPSKRFHLRSLAVGGQIVEDVTASVSEEPGGMMLLGQSFLQKFPRWSIDNLHQKLVLG
jgi:clan AA aspartic protease (TIGR02281 family)